MDQAAMVETQLTPDLVTEGAALIAKLDASGASPDAAMWIYSPGSGGWKFINADVKVGSRGPREVYKAVQRALGALRNQVAHLSFEDISVAKPDAPLIKALRHAVVTGPGAGGIRFSRNVINGTLIEDAYIYRLHRPAA
jgi:hypothetical protein